jgi:hypothetical protein
MPAEQPRAWLYATAWHVIANELRLRTRQDRLSVKAGITADASVEDHAGRVSEQLRVRGVLGGLSPVDREALRLTEWEGLDHSSRKLGRRLTVGVVGATAVIATSTLTITTPWSHGHAASAYTVDKHASGSIKTTIRPAQLKNPREVERPACPPRRAHGRDGHGAGRSVLDTAGQPGSGPERCRCRHPTGERVAVLSSGWSWLVPGGGAIGIRPASG